MLDLFSCFQKVTGHVLHWQVPQCSRSNTLCPASLGKWQGWTRLPLLLLPAPSRTLLASSPWLGWEHRSAGCPQHGLAVEACPLAFTLASQLGVVLTLASCDWCAPGHCASSRLAPGRFPASPGAGIAAFYERGRRGGPGAPGPVACTVQS